MSYSIILYGAFTAAKVGKTGLTPTVDVYQITRSSGAVSQIVTGGGAYQYRYASADLSLYDYVAWFKTTDATVDAQHTPSLWSHFSINDANAGVVVATNNDKTGYTASTVNDKTGYALSVTPPTAAQVRTEIDSNSTQLAALIARNNALDAAGIRAALGMASANMDTQLSGLPLAVWNILASALVLTSSIGKWILDKLNDTITSRMAMFAYTAPDNADIALIKAKTDNLPAAPAAVSNIPTAGQIDTQLSGTHGAGTWGGSAPTVGQIDTQLSGTHGAGLWSSAAGSGAVTWTYNLTKPDNITPVPQAYVWATTDSAGLNVVAEGITDNFGNVTFYLTHGTYYIWRAKAGWSPVNPDVEVVP